MKEFDKNSFNFKKNEITYCSLRIHLKIEYLKEKTFIYVWV